MASAPSDTSFSKSDFPESGLGSQGILDKFFLPLNSVLAAVRRALNGGLTFRENFNAEVKTVSVTTPASGTGVLSCFPFDVSTKVKQPQGVLLLGAADRSTVPDVPALGAPSWILNANGSVRITNVPGLLLGRAYSITLLIVAG